MHVHMDPGWQRVLAHEFEQPYFKKLTLETKANYLIETVYPPTEDVFVAFSHTPFSKVKVVILGQDPYHGEGQAHGLAFSVPDGRKIPPSLRNVYKEIQSDIGTEPPASGNLERWAKQGVLLLNSTLTVQAGAAGSHQKRGWEDFTDAVIQKISDKKEHVVFMLWGAYAIKKGGRIDATKHLVLTAAHPSPLSAHNGFFGCRHFSQCSTYLTETGLGAIMW